MPKKKRAPATRKRATIPGQAKPIDAATGVVWNDKSNFAELFNRTILRDCPINPDDLQDADTTESSIVELREGAHITLKQIRDVAKSLAVSGTQLAILGIENQTNINYMMAFRVLSLDYINYARQISEIQSKHKAAAKQQEGGQGTLRKGEYIGGFHKEDKLKPAITLVVYYGEEPWDAAESLSGIFEDSPWKEYASDYKMNLLDIRRMDDLEIGKYSDQLRAFFGFLKKEKTDKLEEFIDSERETFSNLPDTIMDALIEITRSKQLEKIKRDYRTPEGGTNVCYGIEAYATNRAASAAAEASMKTFVETYQDLQQTVAATIKAFITKFNVTEDVAEQDVKKYWKN